ncbi:MAG TPA: hypothetical protein VFE23_21995 [Usitatibacter sp.]|jgi:hypothetical protein|nr:hypothetical protein [Usitatibacter sp.]
MSRRGAIALALGSLLAGCATDGTSVGVGVGAEYYGPYDDDWWYAGGGCCIDYPNDIGPPHPEHPIVLPPGSPRPSHPVAPPASSSSRPMPSPRPAASMGGGGFRGGGGGGRR